MLISRKHLFHLVNPSASPLLVATAVFLFVSNLTMYMHGIKLNSSIENLGSGSLLLLSFISILLCAFFWFSEILVEATNCGYHTQVVKKGLALGFWLFIVSEIMLFSGFFWAFFHVSLSPPTEFGFMYPPLGLKLPVDKYDVSASLAFVNTVILILSGLFVTLSHRYISLSKYKQALDNLIITVVLGFFFIALQILEYYKIDFNINDSIYSCVFYMLTGLHGMHVFVGASFLTICFFRMLRRHFTILHYLGFVFAIWYWHFVDVVWVFLFIFVYSWGSL